MKEEIKYENFQLIIVHIVVNLSLKDYISGRSNYYTSNLSEVDNSSMYEAIKIDEEKL